VTGSQSIEIDKDVASGRDMGVSSVEEGSLCAPKPDTSFNYDYKASLLNEIRSFAEQNDSSNQLRKLEIVWHHLRTHTSCFQNRTQTQLLGCT
jgi:hypothetical protein